MAGGRDLVCCDANLAVRYVTEPHAEAVRALGDEWLRTRTIVVAPSLLHYEVANAVHRICLKAGVDDIGALELHSDVMRLPIEIRHVPNQHQRALLLSRSHRLPAAYDAHYLALAESLGCAFYTSDSKLFRTVSSTLAWVQ